MLDFSAFVSSSLLALALGALIGLERERTSSSIVGLRTFAFVSFLGFMATLIGNVVNFTPVVAAIGFIGCLTFAFLYYYFRSFHEKALPGLTTALSVPLTYLLGVLIGLGYSIEAVTSAIAIALLLVERQKVHAVVKTVTVSEIIDGLIFAVIAFVLFPLLPTAPQVFLGYVLDLQLAWKIVVIGSLLSFGAHLLTKYLHGRGAILAAFFGGAVSSIGVIYLFLQESVKRPGVIRLALVASSAGAYLADLVFLLFLAPTLFEVAGFPIAVIGIILLAFTFFYKRGTELADVTFSKPLSLAFVAEFAVLFFLVKFLSDFLTAYFGQTGLFFSSFLGGVASSSAVFASTIALFSQGTITSKQAALSLLIGLTGSMLVKTLLVAYKLKWRDPVKVFAPAVIPLAVGFIVFLLS